MLPWALPPVIGHRGAAASAPENTLAGLRRAKALGCRWVEFDVRLTADTEPILLHDDRLERTTDGRGRAAKLRLAAIRNHDAGGWFDRAFAGERVPTFAEALAVLDEEGLGANVEIKATRGRAYETGAVVAEAVARGSISGNAPVLISSFLQQALEAAQARAPQTARGILFGAVPRNWLAIAKRLGCASIHADHRRLDRSVVADIRAAGYVVLAYTVNDVGRARMLFDWGVTSVFSDVPHLILAGITGCQSAGAAG